MRNSAVWGAVFAFGLVGCSSKGACEALPHQWLPDKDQYILDPDEPFAMNTAYRVVIKG